MADWNEDDSGNESVKNRWDDSESSGEEEKSEVAVIAPPEKKKGEEKQEEEKIETEIMDVKKEEPAVPSMHPVEDSIDTFEPTTKEEFEKLKELIRHKVSQYDKSQHYVDFLDILIKGACQNIDTEEIKKISNSLQAVATEKTKLAKALKGKKTKKANLVSGKHVDSSDRYVMADDVYDDFDDFM